MLNVSEQRGWKSGCNNLAAPHASGTHRSGVSAEWGAHTTRRQGPGVLLLLLVGKLLSLFEDGQRSRGSLTVDSM